ncbi:MAG TPA: flavodoxin family protein [Clostridiaceae bacterium]|nr:flavodoxin family protein [Clostridiaceae bacterium]
MSILILTGSPRANGNTMELCKTFLEEVKMMGAGTRYVTLAGKDISPCLGCYACLDAQGEYGFIQHDDM